MKRRMRLRPDSIGGRIIGLLFLGLVFTVAVSLSVFQLDLFQGKGWDETLRNLQRIAIVASILDRAPPDARIAWLPVLSESRLSISWSRRETPPRLRRDAMARHLARDIRVLSEIYGLERVQAGYRNAAPRASGWLMPESEPVEVWIALSDDTWLRFVVASREIGGLWTVRLVIAAGLLITGILALGLWAARRVTAPLASFTRAAQRLAANVDALPMAESGPMEIREAAKAFNGMQEHIRRLIEDRTLMLAALSHDLRTALTRLRFRTELIADRDQRQKAGADLDAMLAMLQSTLSFARDDAAAEPPAVIDLAVLLQSLCDDLRDAGKPAIYHGPGHLNYLGRPVSLRRAFANLIDNALAYGREATVALTATRDIVEVAVADRGPGIPEKMRGKVFAPFFRLEASRSRETGGVGLGLTVASAVVRRHGGEITLEDRPGGGLRVRVVLPLAAARSG